MRRDVPYRPLPVREKPHLWALAALVAGIKWVETGEYKCVRSMRRTCSPPDDETPLEAIFRLIAGPYYERPRRKP